MVSFFESFQNCVKQPEEFVRAFFEDKRNKLKDHVTELLRLLLLWEFDQKRLGKDTHEVLARQFEDWPFSESEVGVSVWVVLDSLFEKLLLNLEAAFEHFLHC